MNIIILTQPLHTNYGGLIQAYAMQKILRDMGHEVWTEDRKSNAKDTRPWWRRKIATPVKQFLRKSFKIEYYPTDKDLEYISSNTSSFVKNYIRTTVPIYDNQKKEFECYSPACFLVGSDQVWRKGYNSDRLYDYYLRFAEGKNVKRIAYAASFGRDFLDYSESDIAICSSLLKQFDAVSVREQSAASICKNSFGVTPKLVLDPTLLLDSTDYDKIISAAQNIITPNPLMVYVLNHKRKENYQVMNKLSSMLSLDVYDIYPHVRISEVGKSRIEECVVQPVENWLSGFKNAEYVLTDSFHGTVFSIIYKKQFITLDNSVSGSARLRDFLNMLGLANRLISRPEELTQELVQTKIDYEEVYSIINKEREFSINFLEEALK